MDGYAAFWLCLALVAAAFIVCEAWLYWHGHETLWWRHKTPEEKAHARKQLGLDE